MNIDRTLPVDIYDQDNAMIVKAALPGVDPSDVDVSIHEGLLQINAETKSEESIDEADYHRREYSYGKWSRSFQLPNNVAADKAEASYDNGMLRLKIPYTDSETQRTIKIEVK